MIELLFSALLFLATSSGNQTTTKPLPDPKGQSTMGTNSTSNTATTTPPTTPTTNYGGGGSWDDKN